MRTKLLLIALIAAATAMPCAAAVHHNKRDNAYFDEHEKCRAALKTAKAEARKHKGAERNQMEQAARDAYGRCQEYTHLVWKYYPNKPPAPEPARTSTQ